MSGKYIDLADRIGEGAEYSNTASFCLGIECALRWLDEHPDQVPGRTLTRSDMVEAFGEEYAGWATHRLARIGYTIVPDPEPEPTNAEKLNSLYGEWADDPSPTKLALGEWLELRGVKAPGASDD